MAGGQPPFPVPEGAGRFAGWRNRTGLSPSGGNPNVRPPVFWWLPLRSVVNTALTVAVQPCPKQAQPFGGQDKTHGKERCGFWQGFPPPVPQGGSGYYPRCEERGFRGDQVERRGFVRRGRGVFLAVVPFGFRFHGRRFLGTGRRSCGSAASRLNQREGEKVGCSIMPF